MTYNLPVESTRLKSDQHLWNFIFSLLYIAILFGTICYFYKTAGGPPTSIPLSDFLLLSLAIFRLTRLIVYDKITLFFRELFLLKSEFVGKDGLVYVQRSMRRGGPLRTISDILRCPWCAGAWITLLVVFFYYTTPFSWYIIMLFAAAGVGNGLMLISNVIGWRAENLKIDTEDKEDEHKGH